MSFESKPVTFPGNSRSSLSGRLELPAVTPRAYAIFAHCFACTKQSRAAVEISRALADRGIATLRFDFAGLGESEGEFGAEGFAANVGDIRAAARFLASEYRAPSLLVGHSFGGTAVLAAAAAIAGVRAVATIGAPFSPAHVLKHFPEETEAAESGRQAVVEVAGQAIALSEDLVADLRSVDMDEVIAQMNKALLVLHAPLDQIVAIDDASHIFQAARHPKSFVSLDGADHLLSKDEDAIYVAEVIAAWARRYVDEEKAHAAEPPEGWVVVSERGIGAYVQDVYAGQHHLTADEPVSVGGNDLGPGPYDFLLGGLGACTAMTLRMYADRKEWPLEGVSVSLRHEKRHRRDSEESPETESKLDHVTRAITVTGPLSEEQRQRLLEIADKCPVHRTLTSPTVVETTIESGD